jgi:hypothetical protein
MNIRILRAAIAFGLAGLVATAWAGPQDSKCQSKKAAQVAKAQSGCDQPCSGAKNATAECAGKCSGCKSKAGLAKASACSGKGDDNCSSCPNKATTAKAGTCCGTCDKSAGDCPKKAALAKSGSCCGTCGGSAGDCPKKAATATASTCSGKCDGNCSSCKEKAALAAKTDGGCNKGCSGCAHATAKDAEGGCPIGKKVDAMLASMPAVQYRVGTEVTGCAKRAASLAEGNGHSVEYVVGESVYANRGEALEKAATLLEEEAKTLRKMTYIAGGKSHCCPKAAKQTAEATHTPILYRVAGFEFEHEADATAALAAINEALGHVGVAYKVNGSTYHCATKASQASEKEHEAITYVVGEEETGCKKTADLMLAQARVRAIVEAAAKTYASKPS